MVLLGAMTIGLYLVPGVWVSALRFTVFQPLYIKDFRYLHINLLGVISDPECWEWE